MASTKTAEQVVSPRQMPVRRFIQSREIINRELNAVSGRILDETGGQIRLQCDEKVLDFLLSEVSPSSPRRGFVKQVVEHHLTRPLLRLIYTGQITADEALSIEVADDGKALHFGRAQVRQSHRSELL